jgi:hypothetical protein
MAEIGISSRNGLASKISMVGLVTKNNFLALLYTAVCSEGHLNVKGQNGAQKWPFLQTIRVILSSQFLL